MGWSTAHSIDYRISLEGHSPLDISTTAIARKMNEKREEQIVVPPEELAGFPEVAALWPKLLRRSNPEHLRRFGIPDLAFRLTCQAVRENKNGGQPDQRARAAIWHHVAAQCSEGKSEVQTPTEQELRQWMPGVEKKSKSVRINCATCGKPGRVSRNSKFSSCRKCRGARTRSEKVARRLGRGEELPTGWKLCKRCSNPFESNRDDALYCGNRCRQRASRENQPKQPSARPGVTDNAILGVVSH